MLEEGLRYCAVAFYIMDVCLVRRSATQNTPKHFLLSIHLQIHLPICMCPQLSGTLGTDMDQPDCCTSGFRCRVKYSLNVLCRPDCDNFDILVDIDHWLPARLCRLFKKTAQGKLLQFRVCLRCETDRTFRFQFHLFHQMLRKINARIRIDHIQIFAGLGIRLFISHFFPYTLLRQFLEMCIYIFDRTICVHQVTCRSFSDLYDFNQDL